MRVLVLGGTVFVGHAVAAEAIRRGHEVVCAARGSGPVPAGATLVRVDRDAEDGLAPLAGERFDAVVDVATVSHTWVERALRALADRVGHWTFVSTINVYSDTATPGQTADAPLLAPVERHATRDDIMRSADGAALYGAIKVAAENAVRATLGERAFVVRPGLITGPGDTHDRFGYWPARFSRGGRVLVPDVPEQPIQYIDVRDLATWILDAAQRELAGTYDAIGPHRPLPELLADIAELVGVDVEFVPATPEQLTAAKVEPWAGPRSLPLWAPATESGFSSRDVGQSLAEGMPVRPLADAVSAALEHERALGLDRVRKAGLTMEEEADILAGL